MMLLVISFLVACSTELSADKGYDSNDNNRVLFDEYGLTPVRARAKTSPHF